MKSDNEEARRGSNFYQKINDNIKTVGKNIKRGRERGKKCLFILYYK